MSYYIPMGILIMHAFFALLVKTGFNGKIFATQPTIEIPKIILNDSTRIQKEDAVRADKI